MSSQAVRGLSERRCRRRCAPPEISHGPYKRLTSTRFSSMKNRIEPGYERKEKKRKEKKKKDSQSFLQDKTS